ncbi:MAG TPA: hypothetical protein VI524_10780 [Anaerolineales bacterium]|nr:hypothetical protein [Anaerolineales bacterium]
MQISSNSLPKNTFLIFLCVLVILSMILGVIATSRYGAGVASDSVKYLAVAQSLLDGKGLTDHLDRPLLSWPPLYPLLLAGLSLLTGLDVFTAGWYFNIFLLGLNLFLSGVIFRNVFGDKPLYAYAASLLVMTSLSSLRIHATISADPLYLTMTLGLLLAVDRYINERSYAAFAWIVLIAALAPLQRYVGLAVGVTAGIVILVESWRSVRAMLRDGAAVGLASIAPVGWWLVVHNIMTHGTLWGRSGEVTVDPLRNTMLALTKMLHWFAPYHPLLMPVLTRPLLLLGALALILLLLNVRNRARGPAWLQALTARSVYPMMIYSLVYFAAVALTILTNDHRDLFSDRYYVILLVPTMVFVLVTFDMLILPHLRFSQPWMGYSLLFVLILWLVYPIYSINDYLAKAGAVGEPTYNMYNSRIYREMQAVAEIQRIRAEQPDALFYSNYVDAVWFYTSKPVALLPFVAPDPAEAYAGWPHNRPGYIVWFEPNEYKHYLAPKEIEKFAQLDLIFAGKGGKIYYVQSR